MKEIPLFKVYTSPRVAESITEVLDSGWLGQGPVVEEFEKALADFWRVENSQVATVNSCTSALQLALRLADVQPGDSVIVPPMTCAPTAWAVLAAHAKIIWADVDPLTGNIDLNSVDKHVGKVEVKAVMAVDWGGMPCDLAELHKLCGGSGLKLIVDAAHSARSTYRGQHESANADIVCHSFQAIKLLNTGDGGCLVADAKTIARAKLLRWFGIDRNAPPTEGDLRCQNDIEEWGYKFHMNDVAASIGLANLPDIPNLLSRHRDNARYYDEKFDGTGLVPKRPTDRTSSFWLYTILVPNGRRDELMALLKSKGIMSSKVHSRLDKHTVVNEFQAHLPGVDEFYAKELCIPVGWFVDEEDRERIANTILNFL